MIASNCLDVVFQCTEKQQSPQSSLLMYVYGLTFSSCWSLDKMADILHRPSVNFCFLQGLLGLFKPNTVVAVSMTIDDGNSDLASCSVMS